METVEYNLFNSLVICVCVRGHVRVHVLPI